MIAIESHVSAMTLRSWEIRIIERSSSRLSRSRSSRICAWIMTSSAVTGSSAMTIRGLHARAIAIITRCRMPPENSCGYSRARSRWMPTSSSSSPTRFIAASLSTLSWMTIGSAIWSPTRFTGFRAFIAPWKMIEMCFHRIPFCGAWLEDAGNRLNVFSDAHPVRAHRIRGMGLSRFTKPVSSSDLRTRVRRFYAYQTASSFAIWIPFWALWIRGHLSSDFEFTLVDVAFWVGLLVFQLPVGVVADRTPRRRTIILSELFRSAGILGYGLSATFWGYVAANVVWSLGAAFSIGTSAYLYETLLEAGHETEFPRYVGRVAMIQLLSNALGAFVGGVFVGVVGDLRLTLLVGAIVNLAAIGVAVTFREPKVERTPESTYVEQLVQGLRVVRRREGVALLIGVEVFLGVTLYVMAVFRPLYLQALGLSESAIAISISGFLLVAAIWSAFAGTITRVLGEFGTLALLVLMASAAFFGMFGAGQFPGAALLQVPLYIVWSLQPALTTAFLNRRLEPGQRATVLSMGAVSYTLGLVVVEPLAGALTTTTGLLNLGLFLGIVTFFPCAYILARWRTTVAAWPAVTPLPSRLIAGSRVSRFHRLLERMSRLRP